MEFGFGEGVDWSEGGLGVGFQVDGMVIGAVRGKVFGFAFCEDVRIIVVLRGTIFSKMVRSSGDMEEGLGALSPKIVREASMKHGVPCCCRSLKAAAPMI